MAAFRRVLYAALCAGLLSGLVAAAAHQFGTVPLILQAETYEQPAAPEHAAAWEPEDGTGRAAYTTAADLMAAIGFALLLAAGFAWHGGDIGWRDGLLWGLAGFAAVTLAPGLGLPPEVPEPPPRRSSTASCGGWRPRRPPPARWPCSSSRPGRNSQFWRLC